LGLYVPRDNPDLTERSPDTTPKRGQQFGSAQPDLLSHYRLVGLDRRGASVEGDQTARTSGRGNPLGHYYQPCRRGPGLLKLVLEPVFAGGLR